MAFIANDFTPIGSQARSGVAPQVFSYTTEDNEGTVKAGGYFNALRGTLRVNDWIYAIVNTDATVGYFIFFVKENGLDLGTAVGDFTLAAGGTGYTVNDFLTVDYPDGGVNRQTVFEATTVAAGVITALTLIDPGSIATVPSNLFALPLIGGSGADATVDVLLSGDRNIELSDLEIEAT